jgi:ribonuclease P protein component
VLFRHKQHEVSHVDLIVRVQKPFNRSEYKQIQQEFELLITKLNQKVILNAQTLSSVNAAPLLG